MLLALTLFVQLASQDVADDQPLREARSAQARFERLRRLQLPMELSAAGYGHCDVRVGRYCYWYDSTDVAPEPEHANTLVARGQLLQVLARTSIADPTDAWIAGQRVRYLLEAGDWQEAATFAGSYCRASEWWCGALLGTALHVGQQYTEADAAFTRALAAMPVEKRCAWLDARLVADGTLARRLHPDDCRNQPELLASIWKLGQPLWMTGGNDLRSEHLARHTMAEIMDRAPIVSGYSFGWENRELVLRYGWSEWYSRSHNSMSAYSSEVITGHTRSPSYYFLPVSLTGDGGGLRQVTWRLTDSLARSRYAPRHVKRISELPHQLARFARGDSMLLLAAYRTSDASLARDDTRAALALWTGSATEVHGATQTGRIRTVTSAQHAFASVEVYGVRSRHAQRARYAIAPLNCDPSWCLSDLMFVEATNTDSAPEPEFALQHALEEPSIAAGQPLGVYWELQSSEGRSPIRVSLTITPVRVSVLRRMASTLRLARPVTPVRLQWQTPPRREREPYQVTMRLPEDLRGRFRVLLVVERDGHAPQSAEREIVVRR
jgi:hypothetical protein